MAGSVIEEITGSDLEKVFKNGEELEKARQKELEEMDPRMRSAVEKDLEEHPEKVVHSVKKIDGYRLYLYESLNKTDKGTDLELVSPDILSEKLCGNDYIFVIIRTKNPDFVEGQVRYTGR